MPSSSKFLGPLPWAASVRFLEMVTSSSYVPSQMTIVAPALAALIAAWIEVNGQSSRSSQTVQGVARGPFPPRFRPCWRCLCPRRAGFHTATSCWSPGRTASAARLPPSRARRPLTAARRRVIVVVFTGVSLVLVSLEASIGAAGVSPARGASRFAEDVGSRAVGLRPHQPQQVPWQHPPWLLSQQYEPASVQQNWFVNAQQMPAQNSPVV